MAKHALSSRSSPPLLLPQHDAWLNAYVTGTMDVSPPSERSSWLSVTDAPLSRPLLTAFPGKCIPTTTFTFLDTLGEGSYGTVSRALDTRTNAVVALKHMRALNDDHHEQEQEHESEHDGIPLPALREISILRSLRHENIVSVLDIAAGEELASGCWMVMEYCEQVGAFAPLKRALRREGQG